MGQVKLKVGMGEMQVEGSEIRSKLLIYQVLKQMDLENRSKYYYFKSGKIKVEYLYNKNRSNEVRMAYSGM